jgi:hypothetical protein
MVFGSVHIFGSNRQCTFLQSNTHANTAGASNNRRLDLRNLFIRSIYKNILIKIIGMPNRSNFGRSNFSVLIFHTRDVQNQRPAPVWAPEHFYRMPVPDIAVFA